jgi:hypothetical protein
MTKPAAVTFIEFQDDMIFVKSCKIPLLSKGKAIPVTGCEGPSGCETSRLPHFLDNRLTEGGEVVSLTLRQLIIPQEDSWYSFLLEAESTPLPQSGWKD